MKIAIVKASQLGVDCWSALRFTGSCDQCERVEKCKLPEARIGRIKYWDRKIALVQGELQELKAKRLKEVKIGLKEAKERNE
jgi:hypothetical protein